MIQRRDLILSQIKEAFDKADDSGLIQSIVNCSGIERSPSPPIEIRTQSIKTKICNRLKQIERKERLMCQTVRIGAAPIAQSDSDDDELNDEDLDAIKVSDGIFPKEIPVVEKKNTKNLKSMTSKLIEENKVSPFTKYAIVEASPQVRNSKQLFIELPDESNTFTRLLVHPWARIVDVIGLACLHYDLKKCEPPLLGPDDDPVELVRKLRLYEMSVDGTCKISDDSIPLLLDENVDKILNCRLSLVLRDRDNDRSVNTISVTNRYYSRSNVSSRHYDQNCIYRSTSDLEMINSGKSGTSSSHGSHSMSINSASTSEDVIRVIHLKPFRTSVSSLLKLNGGFLELSRLSSQESEFANKPAKIIKLDDEFKMKIAKIAGGMVTFIVYTKNQMLSFRTNEDSFDRLERYVACYSKDDFVLGKRKKIQSLILMKATISIDSQKSFVEEIKDL